MTIGERIRHARNEKKMTLLQLATCIGVREATVQRYESGKIKNISYDAIGAIAEALNVTPAYLMGWEEKTPDDPKADERKAELLEVFNSLPKETQDKFLNILRYLQGEQPKP